MHAAYRTRISFAALLLSFLPVNDVTAADAKGNAKKETPSAKAKVNLKVPDGFNYVVFSDQNFVSSPLSIAIDNRNRVYVAEANRFQRGVVDSRQYNKWFLDEIACNSLDDRQELYNKYIANGTFKKDYFTKFSDQITTLIDSDQNGIADKAVVYADGFNNPLDGNGSSILLGVDGEMYYANIPHIWKLYDKDADGISDSREKLISGFGFRNGVNGHDLHGLEWGVDGRLYFSNGDRGYGITTKEGKKLYSAERGAIFRCEPDGTQLEEFCVGNRNPQDLAFDQYGNLFTVDNNRGRGDQSRVCYLVEQGDYGWNSGHENKSTFLGAVELDKRDGPSPSDLWLAQGEWRTRFPEQPAYCIPSLEFIGGGSVGITFNPGDSMGPTYKNHFFYCAYSSGVYTFLFSPDGGGLKIENLSSFAKGGALTDTEFSTDGRLFIADYVSTANAPEGKKKGFIYTVENPQFAKTPSVLEAHKKLSAGFSATNIDELYNNLFHEDMRVRLFSQFTLARKGSAGVAKFKAAIAQNDHELARLHGIWGIGQMARQAGDSTGLPMLPPLLTDKNWRIRAQAIKVLGETKDPKFLAAALPILSDANDRVRFFALTAIGKLAAQADKSKATQTTELLLAQLKHINDGDVFLRHSAIAGLSYIGQHSPESVILLLQQATNDTPAVRRGALLALTKIGDGRIVGFLRDKDPVIVQEAILAIDRLNSATLVQEGYQALESYCSGKPIIGEPHIERLLQWCFRVGSEQAARLVVKFIRNQSASENLRRIALQDIIRWKTIPPVDPVIGQIRPVNKDRFDTNHLLKETLASLLEEPNKGLSLEADVISGALAVEIKIDAKVIADKLSDPSVPAVKRIGFLNSLEKARYPGLDIIVEKFFQEENVSLRAAAYNMLAKKDEKEFKKRIERNFKNDSQAIYLCLSAMKKHGHNDFLLGKMKDLADGKHPPESEVELLEAAKATGDKKLKKSADDYEKKLKDSKDPLAIYRGTLYGGDPINGRSLIIEQNVGQCIICHKFEGKGGIVAPDLSQIAMQEHATREYLLESLIVPGAKVVPGFGNTSLKLKDGEMVMGSFIKEDKQHVTLKFVDGSLKEIPLLDIVERTPPISSMPPMGGILKTEQIRDVIAYLATLNKPIKAAEKENH